MKIKLQLSSDVQLNPATEGFWTKLQHTFTRDSKSASIVDILIKQLIGLKQDQRAKFDEMVVDFYCPKGEMLRQATKFTEIVTKFMVENFESIKKAELKSNDANDLYSDLITKLNSVRGELDKNMSKFVLITEEKDEALKKSLCYKGRTYKDMGLTVSSVTTIAKDFRRGAASHLSKLKDAKWATKLKSMAEQPKPQMTRPGKRRVDPDARTEKIGNFATFYAYARMAIKLYGIIDYFLFYTQKKVSKI